jgi:uncharacterized damage-inducible protein DinB
MFTFEAKLIDTMKELLCRYAQYTIWANKRLIEVLLKLDDSILDAEVNSSFASIRKTVYHIWSAEFVWLQRLELAEHPLWMEHEFKGTFQEACEAWVKTSEALLAFIERQYDDKALEHVFQYYSPFKKENFKRPVHVALLHVFNHSTSHRGQLITLLRQAGVTKIPETDLIAFAK